ncbi:MAG: glycosyltransferase family 39 protein [Ignavibacteria bacterium]|nr:glycosyltransferase family 39 protein [Ignavibacteria bacterium]
MPPLYVFYIYAFLNISNVVLRNLLLILSHIIFSVTTIYFMYRFCLKYFNLNTAIISSIIMAVVPEYIYITSVYNAICLYHFLILAFLLLIFSCEYKSNSKIFFFSLLASLLILLRSEFALFLMFVYLVILLKKEFRFAIITFIFIVLFISPWIIRNYAQFGEFIPFTTSSGLNLYRGNNPIRIGNWGDDSFILELKEISKPDNFEIVYNKYYTDKTIDYIRNNPFIFVRNSFVKVFHLLILNPDDTRSKNLFYMIPSLFIVILSTLGIIKSYNYSNFKYLYLFIFSSIIVSVIFFALPRYQIMMKIALIPFCAFYLNHIYKFIRIKQRKNVLIKY